MSTYNDAHQAVRVAIMAGGFSAPQADVPTAAIEGLLEQLSKLAQALAPYHNSYRWADDILTRGTNVRFWG